VERDDLAAVITVGLGAASAHQLLAADRATRTQRWRFVRWLNTHHAPLALFAFGCWQCAPMWYSTVGHLRRWRTPFKMVGMVLASRAVAKLVAKTAGWDLGEWRPVTLPNGTVGIDLVEGPDYPPDVPWGTVVEKAWAAK
jgi:hypothetical protein